jgi:hypothetical protein
MKYFILGVAIPMALESKGIISTVAGANRV